VSDLTVSAQVARIKAAGAEAVDVRVTGPPLGTALRALDEAGWRGIVMANGGNLQPYPKSVPGRRTLRERLRRPASHRAEASMRVVGGRLGRVEGAPMLVDRRAFMLSAATAVVGAATPAFAATPTPEPGGANQLAGVEGGLSSTLFNGQLRLSKMAVRAPVPADNLTNDFLLFECVVSNGTSQPVAGYFHSSIADADGVTVDGHSPGLWNLQQAQAYRLKIDFHLPANFVPVKIVLVPTDPKYKKVFRVDLKASDLPHA
jgi:hypothetical protein